MIKAWIFEWDKNWTSTKQVDFVRKRFKSCHWRMSTGTAFLLEGGGWLTFANSCPLHRCKLRSLRFEKPWDEPPTGLAGGLFPRSLLGCYLMWGFPKMLGFPNNHGFSKNDHFGVVLLVPHLRKHPSEPDDFLPSFWSTSKSVSGNWSWSRFITSERSICYQFHGSKTKLLWESGDGSNPGIRWWDGGTNPSRSSICNP